MKKNEFKSLEEDEKYAKMFAVLDKRCDGKLTKDEINRIIFSVGLNHQYKIEVFNMPDEYLEECIKINTKETSKDGSRGVKAKITQILNNCVFIGTEKTRIRNGDGADKYESIEPSFIDEGDNVSAIYKEVKDWSLWKDDVYSNVYRYICIYIPQNRY